MFTSESGEWKLGGFDVLSSMKEEDAIIYVSDIWKCVVGLYTHGDLELTLKIDLWQYCA